MRTKTFGVEVITSRSESGTPVAKLFTNLRGFYDLSFEAPNLQRLADLDVVFFATPHGVAQGIVPEIGAHRARVIDLSADFRLRDPVIWEKWYGKAHSCPGLLDQVVYGLPERNRESLRNARLVAVPGCYPTAVQLGFLPLLESGAVRLDSLIANAASGVSGAGRQASIANLLTEASDNLKAYSVAGHRHLPEITQGLSEQAGEPVQLTFVPHLAPMIRGIHATLYARLTDTAVDLQAMYETRFADEPFVDVMPSGSCPETRSVRGGNVCRLAVYRPGGGDVVVVLSVIDNLVKGAAGQAIQAMNLMFGLEERRGLNAPSMLP